MPGSGFGLFPDTSSSTFAGVDISLSVVARACKPGRPWVTADLLRALSIPDSWALRELPRTADSPAP